MSEIYGERSPAEGRKAGNGGSRDPPDRPLLDLSDGAIKALLRTAKKCGYVTHDQINALLASDEVNSEQIENILSMFSEIGINVNETKEARLGEGAAALEELEEDKEETEGENEIAGRQELRDLIDAARTACAVQPRCVWPILNLWVLTAPPSQATGQSNPWKVADDHVKYWTRHFGPKISWRGAQSKGSVTLPPRFANN
jgi:Sigma-70 factor, region 1.1